MRLFLRTSCHHPYNIGDYLMSLSAAFEAQVTRLAAYVDELKKVTDTGPAVDAEAAAALASSLDAAGAPPAPLA